MVRKSSVDRKTRETEVSVAFCIDGDGSSKVVTGNGFFDHMLILFCRHGLFELSVTCRGDVEVDPHHSVEDVGLVIGQALSEALTDRRGIERYGFASVVHDDAWVMVSLDLSGRPYSELDLMDIGPCGDFTGQLAEEFIRSLAVKGGMTVHVKVMAGRNDHHVMEAVFKALGRALRCACACNPRITGVNSSKGVL